MHSLDFLQEKINSSFDLREDSYYNRAFLREPNELYEPIAYAMSQGGKRIRPLLTLMGADLFQGDLDKALYPAHGVEILHNFTLLHDDIMDLSPLRRGEETVYKKFGTNAAILSGDTMFALAFKYILEEEFVSMSSPLEVISIMNTLNTASIEICQGQAMDMAFEKREDVSIEEYIEMIRLKTAVLLAAALKMGAISSGAKKEDIDNLYSFGENIGLAFQLQDDILDCWSNLEDFGKVTGTDIADNKKTFLYLKALERANASQKEELLNYFSSHSFDRMEKEMAVKKIYEDLNIRSIAKEKMQEYHDNAMKSLEKIEIDILRKANLIKFAEMLMVRNK